MLVHEDWNTSHFLHGIVFNKCSCDLFYLPQLNVIYVIVLVLRHDLFILLKFQYIAHISVFYSYFIFVMIFHWPISLYSKLIIIWYYSFFCVGGWLGVGVGMCVCVSFYILVVHKYVFLQSDKIFPCSLLSSLMILSPL